MKRLLVFILTAVLLLSLPSCFLLPAVDTMEWAILNVTAEDAGKGDLVIVKKGDTPIPPAADGLGVIAEVWQTHAPTVYQISDPAATMDKEALDALDEMLTAFYRAQNTDSVLVRAAYLTAEELGERPADHLTGLGCELKYVTAEEDGTVVTHDLSEDPTYAWFAENGYKYGFVQRYPADKTDVTGVSDYTDYFRYVGTLHAEYMAENGLCLEEYIERLKGYDRMDPLSVYASGEHYELFYADVPASGQVLYPAYATVTYSGTGTGGIVVVIKD